MSGKLTVEEISKGRYRLTLIIDIELASGLSHIRSLAASASSTPHFSRKDPPAPDQRRLALTVEEVAEELHIGRDNVYHLLRTGQLESIKIGKLRRIPFTTLQTYINRMLAEGSRLQTPR